MFTTNYQKLKELNYFANTTNKKKASEFEGLFIETPLYCMYKYDYVHIFV